MANGKNEVSIGISLAPLHTYTHIDAHTHTAHTCHTHEKPIENSLAIIRSFVVRALTRIFSLQNLNFTISFARLKMLQNTYIGLVLLTNQNIQHPPPIWIWIPQRCIFGVFRCWWDSARRFPCARAFSYQSASSQTRYLTYGNQFFFLLLLLLDEN